MKQFELDRQIRRDWGAIKPITKVVPNKKKYNKKKEKINLRKELNKYE